MYIVIGFMKSLYLVDSSIYVFNAWFGLPDSLVNEDGQPNNAFLGFTDFVYRLLARTNPPLMVFAFDESLHHCARKSIYPEYKANRAPAPEELKRQFAWCRQWVQALGFSQVASNRHEADDLIGTLAHLNRSASRNIIILTADKDLAQLIEKKDLWWSFAVDQQHNYRAIMKKFGVRPEQIADQLALAGDKVDNIPGIPGIGMTIAARLLTKFDSLQNLRENLDQVRDMKFRGAERVMNLLKEHESILDISSRLTPINCQVAEMKKVDIKRGEVNIELLDSMLQYQRMGEPRVRKWHKLLQPFQD